ncbi:MAG: transposase [Planctomycetota bacterium]|jgi:transposase
MMGPRQQREPKLFYAGVNLDERIPAQHFLRQLDNTLDLEFVRPAVAQFYGYNGNESVDPIVLIKLMLLLTLEAVPSERQLVEQLGFRMDWMWFCGFDFDDEIPHHSVLSKARRLWGVEVFTSLFARVLHQCLDAGLVDGEAIHVDASCIAGNVDKSELQPVLRVVARDVYDRLDEEADGEEKAELNEPTSPNSRLTSRSDPEAGVTVSHGRTVCGYKDHRAVDDAHGIITATVTTDAATNEGHVLEQVIDSHRANTEQLPETVVADKQYGTAANYRHLRQHEMTPCIPRNVPKAQKGKFGHDAFTYDTERDCFHCPAGQELHRYHCNRPRRRIRYRAAKGVCLRCPLRMKCTDSKDGRRVERHMDQVHIDWAESCLSKGWRRHWMRRRKIVAEGSFADAANNHGYKRARWRGLMKMTIQNLLVATCQNLRKLVQSHSNRSQPSQMSAFTAESWSRQEPGVYT